MDNFDLIIKITPHFSQTILFQSDCKLTMTVLHLSVQSVSGTQFRVAADSTDTVAQLKTKLHKKADSPCPELVQLIYSGAKLQDDKPLSDYHLMANTQLHMVATGHNEIVHMKRKDVVKLKEHYQKARDETKQKLKACEVDIERLENTVKGQTAQIAADRNTARERNRQMRASLDQIDDLDKQNELLEKEVSRRAAQATQQAQAIRILNEDIRRLESRTVEAASLMRLFMTILDRLTHINKYLSLALVASSALAFFTVPLNAVGFGILCAAAAVGTLSLVRQGGEAFYSWCVS